MELRRVEVTEIYVATFNRAPDTAGLDYWTGTDLTIEGIAASFFAQNETQEKYPDTLNNAEFVNEVYNNVYNRDGDFDGATYWIAELNNGTPRDAMIIAMVNGAQGIDEDVLSNKTEVGLAFADAGLSDYDNSVDIMSDVTDDDATVIVAEAQIGIWAEYVATYTMLVTRDDYTGTDDDDTILGITSGSGATTYQTIDTIDGGEGDNDMLKIQESDTLLVAKNTQATTVSNIEILSVTDNHIGALVYSIDLTNYDRSVSTVISGGTSTNTAFGTGVVEGNFENIVADLHLTKSVTATTAVNYEASATSAANDTMDITMASGVITNQTFVTIGIENLNVHTGTGNLIVNEGAANLTSISIDGTRDMILSSAALTTVSTIDASVATGAITVLAPIMNLVTGTTYIGGLGADNVTGGVGADNLSGDVGNDTLAGGAGDDIIDGGQGIDTLSVVGGANRFDFANTGDTGTTVATADSIRGFVKIVDTIDFDTLAAGRGTGSVSSTGVVAGVVAGDNFAINAAVVVDFAAAQSAAEKAFGAGMIYSFQSDGTNGYLFVDSDGDGLVDDVVNMIGLNTVADMAAGDIIA